MKINKISVYGLGYIGLPTATVLAAAGKKVVGIDIKKEVVDIVNQGKVHIVEPGLEELVKSSVLSKNLTASVSPTPSDVHIIAVPTPFKNDDSSIPVPDISYIESAASSICNILKKGDLVILESTSPVGTTERIAELMSSKRKDLSFPNTSECPDINVAYCPERVLPGKILKELINNDRVIGGLSKKCSEKAKGLYEIFIDAECVITNARTAEMTKLTENSCRDVQIAFANELSIICKDLDINVWELIQLANRHPRINILEPGPGVGGHCIAVDPWFIVSKNPNQAKLIHTSRMVNLDKPKKVLEEIKLTEKNLLSQQENSTTPLNIIFYGATFKPDIDDLRESPSYWIIDQFSSSTSNNVYVVEPNISNESLKILNAELISQDETIEAHMHVLLVNHSDFRNRIPSKGVVLDFCGGWNQN